MPVKAEGTQKKPSMGGKMAGKHAPPSTCYDRGGKKMGRKK